MRKEEYIREVISRIENKKAQKEVERELSAHIDDRISYYADAGYDEQTANDKAIEHMGKPEKVGRELSRLHRGVGKYFVLAFLLALLLLCGFLDPSFFMVDLFSVSVFIMEDLSTDTSNLLVFINSKLLYITLFVLTLAGVLKKKTLLKVAMGMEFYLMVRGLPWMIAMGSPHLLICSVIPLVLFSLSFVLVYMLEKEQSVSQGEKPKVKFFGKVGFSAFTALILFAVSVFGSFGVDMIYEYEQFRQKTEYVPMTFERYAEDLDLPTEIADESLTADFDANDFGKIKDLPGYARWVIDEEMLKVDYKLPDKYNDGNNTYFIDSEHPEFLFTVTYYEEDDDFMSDWSIRKDYKYPDLDTDEISKIQLEAFDERPETDLTDLIVGDSLKEVKRIVKGGPTGQYLFLNAFEKHLFYEKIGFYDSISWYFKDYYGIHLEDGDLYINDDGKCFISPQVETTYNAKNYHASEEGLVSNGIMFIFDEETSEKICERVKKK